MTSARFLSSLSLFTLPLLPLAIACGGNVVVDPSGSGTGGLGGANGGNGGTTTTTLTVTTTSTTGQGGTTTTTTTTGQGGATLVCEGGYTPCYNQYCADLQNDPYNCGGCSVACGGDGKCLNGGCVYPPDCVTCSDYISSGQGPMCPDSEQLYNDFVTCACVGNCEWACGDNACVGNDITPECQDCLTKTGPGFCGDALNACFNDI